MIHFSFISSLHLVFQLYRVIQTRHKELTMYIAALVGVLHLVYVCITHADT